MYPVIRKIKNETLLQAAQSLNCFGTLARTANNLIYLDIDDAYIHQLFPLIQNKKIKKPNYFGKGSAGAHISVIYPEETFKFDSKDLGKQYEFTIKYFAVADINLKKYYVFLVDSPMLIQLRNKYGLPNQLNFKNYWIDLHITIGVSQRL